MRQRLDSPAAQCLRLAHEVLHAPYREDACKSADRRMAEDRQSGARRHVTRLDVTICVLSAPHRQRHRTHDLHSIFRRAASSANAHVNLRVGPKWKHAKASIGLKTLAIAHGKRRPTENRVRWRPLDMRLCLWVAWVTRHRRLSVALPRCLLRLPRARGRPGSPNEIRAEFRCVPGDMRDLKSKP